MVRFHFDLGSDTSVDQLEHAIDQRIDLYHLRVECLASGEGQEALGQRGGWLDWLR